MMILPPICDFISYKISKFRFCLEPQAAPGAKLTSEETSAEGSISAAVVNAFIGAIGGPLWFTWLIFGYILVGSWSTFGS